jgi:hypothetical protein
MSERAGVVALVGPANAPPDRPATLGEPAHGRAATSDLVSDDEPTGGDSDEEDEAWLAGRVLDPDPGPLAGAVGSPG